MLNGNKKIIKHKVGLLNLVEELGNVSKACRIMGLSRDTFYRYKTAVDEGGIDSLIDKDRRKPNLKNRVDEQTEVDLKMAKNIAVITNRIFFWNWSCDNQENFEQLALF